MKLTLVVPTLTALLLAACSQAPSSDTATGKDTAAVDMSASEHAQMADPVKPTSDPMAQPAKIASATGMVESLDADAGKIIIAHGPVEALSWPAMTMGFKATPEQIASVQVGQKVQFEFQAQAMDATITKIVPQE